MIKIILLLSIFIIKNTVNSQQNCTITTPQPVTAYANCSFLNALQINWKPIQTLYVSDLILSSLTNLNTNLAQTIAQINLIETLKSLDFSSNNLNEDLNGDDLQKLDCCVGFLRTIILSYNSFTRIPLFNETCSHRLETLYMNNNPKLVDFDRLFNNSVSNYHNMTTLKYLDVSNCNIQVLNGNRQSILQFMPNLVSLNLRNNKIKQICETPFIWAPGFTYLNMDDNLLECNYSSLWFKYYLLNTNINYLQLTGSKPYDVVTFNRTSYAPMCAYNLLMMNTSLDPSLTRFLITELDDNLFYTDVFSSTNLTTNIFNLKTNDYIDLNCLVFSVPESEITWALDNRELSRITNNIGDPYLFIDNIEPTTRSLRFPKGNRVVTKNATKSSTLRIQKINTTYQGVYECRTSYTIEAIRNLMTKNILFTVNVKPLPKSALSVGDIVGIVFACIIGLLLLLLLLGLCLYFICYKRRLCCFKEKQGTKLYKNSTGISSTKYYNNGASDFNSGGFQDDIAYTKPNYLTYPSQINEQFYNQNSNATTTTNTITDNSTKSMTNLELQKNVIPQTIIHSIDSSNNMGNLNADYNQVEDDDNDNVYNVNNPQAIKYYVNQQPDEFDTLYSINTNTISTGKQYPQIQEQQIESYRITSKTGINTLNNGIYFPQQQQNYNTDVIIDADNSNFEEFYEQYYVNKHPIHNQQQHFNNSFIKYDSDV